MDTTIVYLLSVNYQRKNVELSTDPDCEMPSQEQRNTRIFWSFFFSHNICLLPGWFSISDRNSRNIQRHNFSKPKSTFITNMLSSWCYIIHCLFKILVPQKILYLLPDIITCFVTCIC